MSNPDGNTTEMQSSDVQLAMARLAMQALAQTDPVADALVRENPDVGEMPYTTEQLIIVREVAKGMIEREMHRRAQAADWKRTHTAALANVGSDLSKLKFDPLKQWHEQETPEGHELFEMEQWNRLCEEKAEEQMDFRQVVMPSFPQPVVQFRDKDTGACYLVRPVFMEAYNLHFAMVQPIPLENI